MRNPDPDRVAQFLAIWRNTGKAPAFPVVTSEKAAWYAARDAYRKERQ